MSVFRVVFVGFFAEKEQYALRTAVEKNSQAMIES